jgi:hypothetical protein
MPLQPALQRSNPFGMAATSRPMLFAAVAVFLAVILPRLDTDDLFLYASDLSHGSTPPFPPMALPLGPCLPSTRRNFALMSRLSLP